MQLADRAACYTEQGPVTEWSMGVLLSSPCLAQAFFIQA